MAESKGDGDLPKPYPVKEYGDPNSRTLIIGKSGSGKTTAMTYLLAEIHGNMGRVRYAHGISKSEPCNGRLGGLPGYTGILPKYLVSDTFDPERLTDLMNSQRRYRFEGEPRDAMVIMEDIGGSDAIKSIEMERLFTEGRVMDLGVMATSHCVKGIPCTIADDVGVIVAFDTGEEAKSLYEKFFRTEFGTFAAFKACYDPIVNPPETPDREGKWRRRRAMVLDMRRPAGERIFSLEVPLAHAQSWSREPGAPIVPLPKLCRPVHWAAPYLGPVKDGLKRALYELNSYGVQ